MNALETVKNTVTTFGGRTFLKMQKHSPEILVVSGCIGMVGAAVLACRATLKANEVLDKHEEDMAVIERATDTASDGKYPEKDRNRDIFVTYAKTVGRFARLYGPSVALGAASVTCILVGHNILQKRHLAVLAAYNGLSEAFERYRKRIIEDHGAEYDRKAYLGLRDVDVEETDEKGKTKKRKDVAADGHHMPSQYARFFDESSVEFKKNAELNLMFLRGQQAYFNQKLRSEGHVFLNEVYDALDIPRSKEGQIVGWILGEGRENEIDFGLYDVLRDYNHSTSRFVNGLERAVLLDFNVDGIIFDLI